MTQLKRRKLKDQRRSEADEIREERLASKRKWMEDWEKTDEPREEMNKEGRVGYTVSRARGTAEETI